MSGEWNDVMGELAAWAWTSYSDEEGQIYLRGRAILMRGSEKGECIGIHYQAGIPLEFWVWNKEPLATSGIKCYSIRRTPCPTPSP